MSHAESSKGDTLRLNFEVISSVVNDKFTREHQGKKAERVFFLPADNETKCRETLEKFFLTLKIVFGKMPEGDLTDLNFKKWAADALGLVVNGALSKTPSSKNPEEIFVNVNLKEKSTLTPDDVKALEKAGAEAAAKNPTPATASSPAATSTPAPSGLGPKVEDLEEELPF